jgi:hypothetical protein
MQLSPAICYFIPFWHKYFSLSHCTLLPPHKKPGFTTVLNKRYISWRRLESNWKLCMNTDGRVLSKPGLHKHKSHSLQQLLSCLPLQTNHQSHSLQQLLSCLPLQTNHQSHSLQQLFSCLPLQTNHQSHSLQQLLSCLPLHTNHQSHSLHQLLSCPNVRSCAPWTGQGMLEAPCPGPLAPGGLSLGPAPLSGGQLHPARSAMLPCPASRSRHSGLCPPPSGATAVRSTLALQHIHVLTLKQYGNSNTLSLETQTTSVI